MSQKESASGYLDFRRISIVVKILIPISCFVLIVRSAGVLRSTAAIANKIDPK